MDSDSSLILVPVNDFGESTRFVDLPAEILRFMFGSLPRPPENCFDLIPRCNFAGLVCLQFLKSLFKHIDSRYISIDDVVALWRFLECGCVLREMGILLGSFQHNLEYGIDDGWLVMLLEYLVFRFRKYMQLVSREYIKNCLTLIYDFCKFTRFRFFVESSTLWCGVVHDLCTVSESDFRHQNPLRQGENFKYVVVICCCLDLYGDDCYSFLQLELLVYEVYLKMLMNSGGLQVLAPLDDGSLNGFYANKMVAIVQNLSLFIEQEACCFEVLMSFVFERLLQFYSYVSAHMRLMEQRSPSIDAMEVMLQSRLTRDNSFSSKWLDLHVIIGSQSCVSRQGKILLRLATLIRDADCVVLL